MSEGVFRRYSTVLVCVFLVGALVAVFGQVYEYDFVNYDDHIYVIENDHLKEGLSQEGVFWSFTTSCAGNWHPLTWLSLMLDYEIFGLKAGWFHINSLVFHVVNTVLLFLFLAKMTGVFWRSFFVAAAFGLHPLHVESVAWISERKDVLSGFFWILTMWVYFAYVRRGGISRYVFALIVFGLGLMSKPMLVTLPCVLLLLDYWPLERFSIFRERSSKAGDEVADSGIGVGHIRCILKLILEKIPFFILSVILSFVTLYVQRAGGMVRSFTEISVKARICNAVVSYVKYAFKMIWPSRLAVIYPFRWFGFELWEIVGAVLLLCVGIWLIWVVRSHRWFAVGLLWYLGTLVPVIGLIQVGEQAIADRYTYLPIIGLFIIVSWGVPELVVKWRYRRIFLVLSTVAAISGMMICSRRQVRYWRNSYTLFSHAVDVTEDNYVAHHGVGVDLVRQGREEAAVFHYREAIRIKSDFPDAHGSLGMALLKLWRLEEAAEEFREALRLGRDNLPRWHRGLATTLFRMGDTEEGILHYRKALAEDLNDAESHNSLAIALMRLGEREEAVKHFEEAVRLNPEESKYRDNLNKARIGRLKKL